MGLVFTILAITLGIFLLGILVFVHEAGHFFTAKFFKIKVEEFGFGFPPRLWGKRRGETIYTINAIPAGGFVRLLGEDGEAAGDSRSFAAKGPWVRATVIAAGVMVNLIVAFLIFSILLAGNSFRFDTPLRLPLSGELVNVSFPFGQQTNSALIEFVAPGSPAEKAGLKAGDLIIGIIDLEKKIEIGTTGINLNDAVKIIRGKACLISTQLGNRELAMVKNKYIFSKS